MELYIHIPFCRQKCRYCDFASWAGKERLMEAYVEAVVREAEDCARSLGDSPVETVFIGGGTPSLLPPALLERLLTGVFAHFPPLPGAEVSCECNPGTLTEPWLETALRLGVDRLSMGVQARQAALLKTLGRIHDWAAVETSVAMARAAGFHDLNLDLMFGLPGQTQAQWRETVEAALALHPEHLSCYGLIPEEGTPLFDALTRGELALPEEEDERAMYDFTLRRLAEAGFRHYEISNFALPGRECRHNLGYWRQTPYLGLGAAAASMLPTDQPGAAYLRRTNVRRVEDYLAQAEGGRFVPAEEETVTRREAMFETMMLGLRTMQGVEAAAFQHMHGPSLASVYGPRLERLAAEGLLTSEDGWWRLTRRGMDVQNALLVELMDD